MQRLFLHLARRVDLIISGLPYHPRWTEDVAYTRNYFNAGQVLVTRTDNPAIKTVGDLTGHTIAVEWGSQAEMEARRLQNLPSSKGRGGEGKNSNDSLAPSTITLLRQDAPPPPPSTPYSTAKPMPPSWMRPAP